MTRAMKSAGGVRLLWVSLLVLGCVGTPAFAAPAEPYFNLSTYKSFAPGETAKLHLYARNVDKLEFRVYRIEDPDKFVAGLPQMHSFGDHKGPPAEVEQIDEKTWLERFHDWKRGLWSDVKEFVREQLSHKTRQALTQRQSGLARRSRVGGVAEFAQIPLLNDKQLVARWWQEMPPTFVSDNQVLPIDKMAAGMYLVEATDGKEKAYTILLVSETALVTRMVAGNMLAFTVDRRTGAPIAGATVSVGMMGYPLVKKTTDDGGVAEFVAPDPKDKTTLGKPVAEGDPDSQADQEKMWVIARKGNDVALVAPYGGSFTSKPGTTYTNYVYMDRPVYRPGNVVHWKAVLRQYTANTPVLPTFKQVHVEITDAAEKKVFEGDMPVSATGTVNGDVTLAKDAALGSYRVELNGRTAAALANQVDEIVLPGGNSFEVQEYRKPEYEVRVSAAQQHLLQGNANTMTIDSKYFFGEPVVGAKVKYAIQKSAHSWWDVDDDEEHFTGSNPGEDETPDDPSDAGSNGEQEGAGTGVLNADGRLVVKIPTQFAEKEHQDKDYTVTAGVTDAAGREISGAYKFLATYGSFRLQVEPVSYFARVGEMSALKVTAVDYEGKPVATKVHLKVTQTRYTRGKMETTDAGLADTATDATGTGTAQVKMGLPGSIEVLASAETPEHRTVEDATWVYVSGGPRDPDDEDEGDAHAMKILTDKKTYAPGDTAHLSLVGDVTGFSAMITATGYSVEFRKTLTTTGQALTFDLPITADAQPNVTVDAVLVKDGVLYQARKSVKVPPTQQALKIEITPAAATFQPQQIAAYDVVTKDVTGKRVSADLSFGVVDEAIYALYKDHSGDLLKSIYPDREMYSNFDSSLTYYFSGEAGNKSPMLAERRSRYRPMLAQVKPVNDAKAPHVRKDFPDTAFWAPDIHTDASGHARVTLKFPDSLTTWRTTVRAVTADSKAGSVVNRVIVRKNIIVRMGQPRFLRKGDVVSVPVIVHNYLTTAKAVTLSLDATGLDVVGGQTQVVQVPAKGEATAVWKLKASNVGTAKLLAKAISEEESDALEMTVPVKPSGVAKTLNASGVVAGSGEKTEPVTFPAGTDAVAHGLTVVVSPSVAGSVFGALDYLSTFPYGCTEQTMSSFLPNILIADATAKLGLVKTVDRNVLDARIEAGFARLADYQHGDGGWGWWKEDTSQVFMTAYVVSGYGQAKKAGYGKEAVMSLRNGVGFLETTLKAHPRMLPELRAYSVYALAEAGTGDKALLKAETDTLYGRRKDLSAQGLAFMGLAMLDQKDGRAAEIAGMLAGKALKEGTRVSWPSSTQPLLDIEEDSSAETTGYALKFLVHAMPSSPLLTGAAEWLVANRNEGSFWTSTEQTASVLFGLTDYLAVTKELGRDGDVEVWVNGNEVGTKHFTRDEAASGAVLSVAIDAGHLNAQGNTVRVVERGSGRAYYSLVGNYFSTEKSSYQQGTMALNIARDYFKLVAGKNTSGNIVYTLEPLHGAVKQGDVLAVHLGVTGSPAKYLLIEDPIPAGAEFVQDERTYNIVGRPSAWGYWYTRREFHDDRAAIFATQFSKREESFYLLKVVNPGSYAISPASVAPMYQPGVQATTDELHLDVEEVQ